MGSVYAKIGKEKEAKDKYDTALRIFRQSSPSNNSLDTVYTYLKIASLFGLSKISTGSTKEPPCLTLAFEQLEEMPGDSISVKRSLAHANTLRARYLLLCGEYEKAIACCETAYSFSREFGVNHPKMIGTDIVYGDALFAKNKADKALEYFQKAYKEICSINPEHPDAIICKEKINRCKDK